MLRRFILIAHAQLMDEVQEGPSPSNVTAYLNDSYSL